MFACRAKDVRFQTVEILISKGKATTIPPPIPVKFNNSRIQERSLSSVRAVALEKGEGGGKKNMEKKKKERKDEKRMKRNKKGAQVEGRMKGWDSAVTAERWRTLHPSTETSKFSTANKTSSERVHPSIKTAEGKNEIHKRFPLRCLLFPFQSFLVNVCEKKKKKLKNYTEKKLYSINYLGRSLILLSKATKSN